MNSVNQNTFYGERNDIVSSSSSSSSAASSRSNSRSPSREPPNSYNNTGSINNDNRHSSLSSHDSYSRSRSSSSNLNSAQLKSKDDKMEKCRSRSPRQPNIAYRHHESRLDLPTQEANTSYRDKRSRRSRTPDPNNQQYYSNVRESYNSARSASYSYTKNESSSSYYSSNREETKQHRSRDDYHQHHNHRHHHHQSEQRSHSNRDHESYQQNMISHHNHHHHHHRSPVEQRRHSSRDEDERERFAGDYTSICLKNLNESLRIDDLREHIQNEFRHFKDFTVKVVNNRKSASSAASSQTERIAFVNFSNHADAKNAKRAKSNKLFFGYHLYIEPVFRTRNGNEAANSSSSRRQMSPVVYVSRRRSISPPPPPPPPPLLHKLRQRSRSPPPYSSRSKRNQEIVSDYKNNKSARMEMNGGTSSNGSKLIKSNRDSLSGSPDLRYNNNNSHRSRSSSNRDRHRSASLDKKRLKTSHDLASRLSYGGVSHYFDNDERDATRTLFVGNLDNTIDSQELKRVFERFGVVDEIDIKRNQPVLPPAYQINDPYFVKAANSSGQRKTYAFVKYMNMDMAITAKYHLNGTRIGKNQSECRIGYGKVQSSNCLWVGGLTSKSRRSDFEREFEEVAVNCVQRSIKATANDIHKDRTVQIDWRPHNGDNFAYVLFNTISQAEEARSELRGKRLPNGSSERLRIDFVDPKLFKKAASPANHALSHHRSRSISRLSSPDQRLVQMDEYRKYENREVKRRSPEPYVNNSNNNANFSRSSKYQNEYNNNSDGSLNNKRNYSITRSESVSPPRYDEKTKTRHVIAKLPSDYETNGNKLKYESSCDDETTTSVRSLKKIKHESSSSSSLLSGGNFENIIITKTENTRHVNKLSDIINQSEHVKLVSPKLAQVEITRPVESKIESNNTESDCDKVNQEVNESKPSEKEPEKEPKDVEKLDEGEIVEDENKEEKALSTTAEKPTKKSLKHMIESPTSLISEAQMNSKFVKNSLNSIDIRTLTGIDVPSWSGMFTLKKHVFPTKFFLLAGVKEFAEQVLPNQNELNCLRISQRLRLDESKVDELEKKLYDANFNAARSDFYPFSVFVSVPFDATQHHENANAASNGTSQYHQKSLHNLISYLDQKNAAGVIPLPDDDKPFTTMHAFTPNCSLSSKLLNQFFPHLNRVAAGGGNSNDFMLIVIFKSSSSSNSNSLNSAANSI